MEEIPPKSFPPSKARVQSCSSWRQAESSVTPKAYSKINLGSISCNDRVEGNITVPPLPSETVHESYPFTRLLNVFPYCHGGTSDYHQWQF